MSLSLHLTSISVLAMILKKNNTTLRYFVVTTREVVTQNIDSTRSMHTFREMGHTRITREIRRICQE